MAALCGCGQRVEPDVQGVVAGGGRCGANEGVGLFVGAGMARIGDDWAIVFDGDLAEVAYHVPFGLTAAERYSRAPLRRFWWCRPLAQIFWFSDRYMGSGLYCWAAEPGTRGFRFHFVEAHGK